MSISPDRILFQDDHFLAVNKLSGELVVRGKGEMQKLPLLDFLKKQFPGLRTLHRLDFETSGVVVFARTKQAYEAFREGGTERWKKVYRALVMGRIDRSNGDIHFPLPAREEGMVPAETHYRVLERFANSTSVEVEILTGRHHQIRRHFAKIDHPLVLDDEYGHQKFNRLFTREFGMRRFYLHAQSVSFVHPITGEQVKIEAPLPAAFQKILERLRKLS